MCIAPCRIHHIFFGMSGIWLRRISLREYQKKRTTDETEIIFMVILIEAINKHDKKYIVILVRWHFDAWTCTLDQQRNHYI